MLVEMETKKEVRCCRGGMKVLVEVEKKGKVTHPLLRRLENFYSLENFFAYNRDLELSPVYVKRQTANH